MTSQSTKINLLTSTSPLSEARNRVVGELRRIRVETNAKHSWSSKSNWTTVDRAEYDTRCSYLAGLLELFDTNKNELKLVTLRIAYFIDGMKERLLMFQAQFDESTNEYDRDTLVTRIEAIKGLQAWNEENIFNPLDTL